MRKFKKSRHSKREFAEEEEKKKGLSGPTIFAIAVIIIMTASGIGFMWGESSSMKYKDYKFEKTSEGWVTELDDSTVRFYMLPQEAESVAIDKNSLDAIRSTKMIYLTSDLEGPFSDSIGLITYELQNEFKKKGLYSVITFTANNTYGKDIITCSNATATVPVIYLTNSTNTSIIFDNNCIILGSDSGYNFRALRDRVLYGFFGVIQ